MSALFAYASFRCQINRGISNSRARLSWEVNKCLEEENEMRETSRKPLIREDISENQRKGKGKTEVVLHRIQLGIKMQITLNINIFKVAPTYLCLQIKTNKKQMRDHRRIPSDKNIKPLIEVYHYEVYYSLL